MNLPVTTLPYQLQYHVVTYNLMLRCHCKTPSSKYCALFRLRHISRKHVTRPAITLILMIQHWADSSAGVPRGCKDPENIIHMYTNLNCYCIYKFINILNAAQEINPIMFLSCVVCNIYNSAPIPPRSCCSFTKISKHW